MTTDTDPREIWLEPACEKCAHRSAGLRNRLWNHRPSPCPICGKPPTKYVKEE